MLGTAILIAIVGEPQGLAAGLSVSNDGYMFSVAASIAAGIVALALRPRAAERALRLSEPAPSGSAASSS